MADPALKHSADLGLTTQGASSPLTVSYTKDAASNYVVVEVSGDTSADDVTAPTYGGVSMSLIGKVAAIRWTYLYGLANPASGAQDIIVASSTNHFISAIAADFSDVDSVATAVTNTTSGDTLTTSITTTVDNALLLCAEGGYDLTAPPSAGTNATLVIADSTNGLTGLFNSSAIETPTGSYSIQTVRSAGHTPPTGHVLTALYPVIAGSVGTSTGTCTVAGVGASTAASVGAATVTSTVVGFSSGSTGQATGTCTVTGVGASIAASVGASTGTGTAAAIAGFTTLAIADFPADHVFQRASGTTAKDITFTVTNDGGITIGAGRILCRVDTVGGASVVPLTLLLSNFTSSPGTCSGTLSVPQGAWYKALAADVVSGISSDQQADQWGVGTRIFLFGASIIEKLFSYGDAVTAPDAYCRIIGDSSGDAGECAAWLPSDSNLAGDDTGGEGLNRLCIDLRNAIGGTIPLGVVIVERGSSSAADWVEGNLAWDAVIGATGWGSTAIVQGTDFEAAVIAIGGIEATTRGTGTYASDLAAIYTQLQALSGRSDVKFGILQTGTIPAADNTFTTSVRTIERSQSQLTNRFFAGATVNILLADGAHPPAAGMIREGRMHANAIGKALGLKTYGNDGPRIVSASCPIGTTTVHFVVSQGSGGASLVDGAGNANNAALDGFALTASGGQTWTPQLSSGALTAELSSPRLEGETFSFTYGAGAKPFGDLSMGYNDNIPYDNRGAYLGDTRGFTLMPTTAGVTVGLSADVGGRGGASMGRAHRSHRGRKRFS